MAVDNTHYSNRFTPVEIGTFINDHQRFEKKDNNVFTILVKFFKCLFSHNYKEGVENNELVRKHFLTMTQVHNNTYQSGNYYNRHERNSFSLHYSPGNETLFIEVNRNLEEIHLEPEQWEQFKNYLRNDISDNPEDDYPDLFCFENRKNNDAGIKGAECAQINNRVWQNKPEEIEKTNIASRENSSSRGKIIAELNDKNVEINFSHIEVTGDGYCMFRAILAILDKDSSWADKNVKTSSEVYGSFASDIANLNQIAVNVCEELEGMEFFLSDYPLLGDFEENVVKKCFRDNECVIYSPTGIFNACSVSEMSIDDNYSDYLSIWASSFAAKLLEHYGIVIKKIADDGTEFWEDQDKLNHIDNGYVLNVNGNHYNVRLPLDIFHTETCQAGY